MIRKVIIMYLAYMNKFQISILRGNSKVTLQFLPSIHAHSSSRFFSSEAGKNTPLEDSTGQIQDKVLEESNQKYKAMHIEWEKQRLAWFITGKPVENIISDANLSTLYSRLIQLRKNRKKPAIRVNTTSILKNLRNSDPNAVIAFTRPLPLRDMIDIITVLWDEQGLYSSQSAMTSSAVSHSNDGSRNTASGSTTSAGSSTANSSSVESSLDARESRDP